MVVLRWSFFPKRGLRQGDPLALFLFNVVAEGLNGLMRKAKDENMYKAYQVGSNKVEISILQFADDTIFFGKANMENVKTIKAILRSFELVSGLKINFAKSSFGAGSSFHLPGNTHRSKPKEM